VVDAVGVVVAKVCSELSPQTAVAWVKVTVTGDGWTPALVEDRLWSDSTFPLVCGRPARMRAWRALSFLERCGGVVAAELVALVRARAPGANLPSSALEQLGKRALRSVGRCGCPACRSRALPQA
jgi:hypothetical protein